MPAAVLKLLLKMFLTWSSPTLRTQITTWNSNSWLGHYILLSKSFYKCLWLVHKKIPCRVNLRRTSNMGQILAVSMIYSSCLCTYGHILFTFLTRKILVHKINFLISVCLCKRVEKKILIIKYDLHFH